MKKLIILLTTLISNVCWAQLNLKLESKSIPYVSIEQTGTEVTTNRWSKHALPFSNTYSIPGFGNLDSLSFSEKSLQLYSANNLDEYLFLGPYIFNDAEVRPEVTPSIYYQEKGDTAIYEFVIKFENISEKMNFQVIFYANASFAFHFTNSVVPHNAEYELGSYLIIDKISTEENIWAMVLGKDPSSPTQYINEELADLEFYNAAIPSGTYYHFSSKTDGIGNFDALQNFHIQKTNNGLRIDVKNGKYVSSKMFSMSGQLLAKGESYGSENIFFYLNNEIPKNQPIIISMENENGELHSFKYHF